MTIDFYKVPKMIEVELVEGLGLKSVRSQFFRRTPEDLFNNLTSTSQTLEAILYRQEVFRDFITHPELVSISEFLNPLLDLKNRKNDSKIVKHWGKRKSNWCGIEEFPLIYDYAKIGEIATDFAKVSESIVSLLSSANSRVLVALRTYFNQFIDSFSNIFHQWEQDKKMVAQEGRPFFGLIFHDSWSNEIEHIIPLGITDEGNKIQNAISEAYTKGIPNCKVVIDNKEYPLNLTNSHFMFKEKSDRIKHPRQRYSHFELFENLFGTINNSLGLLEQLHFYQEGIEMYTHFTSKGLPMCLPTITDKTHDLDIKDFYPLFEHLKPKQYVLNSFSIDQSEPVSLVTGLNSGGKSTLLRSMGSIISLARAGLPVPASSATIPNVENVVYHITPGDSYEDRLSTFRSQTRAVSNIIARLSKKPNTLLLLNEPLPGTDFETETEGMLDLLRVLAQIYKVPTLVESHCISAGYEIQKDPQKYAGIRLVKFEMSPKTGKPDYIIKFGVGRSEGSYILSEEGLTFEQMRKNFDKKRK